MRVYSKFGERENENSRRSRARVLKEEQIKNERKKIK